MKAVVMKGPSSIDDPNALVDVELPKSTPGPRDLLVDVRAISVNPVDTKVRGAKGASGSGSGSTEPRVLGWDAAGVVVAKGADVTRFKVGDEVFYAGALNRPGSNAEFQAVDERIVGRKPKSIGFAEAAALPLTSITAWELLFDRFGVAENEGGASLLISGAAGGVGSILVQLARKLTKLTIIGTASRPETEKWVRDLGAHHVIDHTQPMGAQIKSLNVPAVKYIASLTQTDRNYVSLVEILSPQGKFGLIDDPNSLDVLPLKRKCASLHWEFMFARSMYETLDMGEQGALLDRVSGMVDRGEIMTTQRRTVSPINAANLRAVHAMLESGRTIGKVTLSGF